MYNVGIIGYGNIADYHFKKITKPSNLKFCAAYKASELKQATDSLEKQKDELNNAKINKEKLSNEYQNLLKSIDSDIKNSEELNNAISSLQKKISDFEESLKQTKEILNKAQKDYATHTATLDLLEKELEKANKTYSDLKLNFDKKLSELLFININDFKDCLLDENEKSELREEHNRKEVISLKQSKKSLP